MRGINVNTAVPAELLKIASFNIKLNWHILEGLFDIVP